VPSMHGVEQYGAKSKTWVSDISSDLSDAFGRDFDGVTVLGESTQLKYLSWDLPRELRCSVLAAGSAASRDCDEEPQCPCGSQSGVGIRV
jgi:hypothetical protein